MQDKQSGAEIIKPYRDDEPKGEQVEEMFDNIAPAYDRMNTAMTLGLHNLWREKALNASLAILERNGVDVSRANILDVATGTGDLVFSLHSRLPEATIEGIDLSDGMLAVAKRKLERLPEASRAGIRFAKADCLHLPFADNSFDLVTVAYGVRNFENLEAGYREMHRVLKPGGLLCVIELSVPVNPVMRGLYNIYTRTLIPTAGRLVSGDSRAYTYLPESIAAAPQRSDMTMLMLEAGFEGATWRSLTPGTVTLYFAKK